MPTAHSPNEGNQGGDLVPATQADNDGGRVASFFLEVVFHGQKARSKLLNDAFYAILCC